MEKLKTKQQGFTLVEVLIAGVILIIVISTMTFVYRTAALSSSKASNSVRLSGSVGLILTTIKSQIRGRNATNAMSGEGSIDDIQYQWQSTLIDNKPAPPRFNASDGNFQTQSSRYYLWQVNLSIQSKTLNKTFQFQEISWRNN